MNIDNWDDLKFVLAMRRHGTMSSAARYLDTNVATVSRRLERITQELGLPLFEKRGAGFVATAIADRLSAIAEDVDQSLRGELANLGRGKVGHAVSIEIAAPPAIHSHFMLPRTAEFAEALPDVLLTLTNKVFAEGLGEADIQIRIGRPEGGRLKARKLRDYALRVYHGTDHVMNGDWIGLSTRYRDSDSMRAIYPGASARPRYRVEEMPMALDMARATGLPCLLPDFMIGANDGLVLADLPGNMIGGELWLTYHETRHGDAVLRSVVDWICRIGAAPLPVAPGRWPPFRRAGEGVCDGT